MKRMVGCQKMVIDHCLTIPKSEVIVVMTILVIFVHVTDNDNVIDNNDNEEGGQEGRLGCREIVRAIMEEPGGSYEATLSLMPAYVRSTLAL